MRDGSRWVVALAATVVAATANAGALLEPKPAPDWTVSRWINADPGRLSDLRGKVVLIEFFQLWCPASNRFSLPLFRRWEELYADREDIALVSIHTVFEGHDVQTPERLEQFVRDWGLRHPVGIDAYADPRATAPQTMERFATEGTPQIAIVDKFGMLRYSHFGEFDPRPVESFIERLAQERSGDSAQAAPPPRAPTSSPSASGGAKARRQAPPPTATRASPGRRGGGGRTPPVRPPERERPTPAPPEEEERAEEPRPEPEEDAGEDPAAAEPTEDDDDAEERDEDPTATIGGKYRLTVQQTARSCGEPLPPQTVFADVSVVGGELLVKFSRRVLAHQELTLEYDPGSGGFSLDLSGTGQDRDGDVEASLAVTGNFLAGSQPPELQFQFHFEQTGAVESLNCVIDGSGSGGKTGA